MACFEQPNEYLCQRSMRNTKKREAQRPFVHYRFFSHHTTNKSFKKCISKKGIWNDLLAKLCTIGTIMSRISHAGTLLVLYSTHRWRCQKPIWQRFYSPITLIINFDGFLWCSYSILKPVFQSVSSLTYQPPLLATLSRISSKSSLDGFLL